MLINASDGRAGPRQLLPSPLDDGDPNVRPCRCPGTSWSSRRAGGISPAVESSKSVPMTRPSGGTGTKVPVPNVYLVDSVRNTQMANLLLVACCSTRSRAQPRGDGPGGSGLSHQPEQPAGAGKQSGHAKVRPGLARRWRRAGADSPKTRATQRMRIWIFRPVESIYRGPTDFRSLV
jgi:hypothetical protein